MPDAIDPPFGSHALPRALERLRRFGASRGQGPIARRAASLIRRICLLGRADPVDVEPFSGQRARLYPRDNLSEKRVFGAARIWDRAERAALARAAAQSPPPFHFVDAGANVGLYSLAVRSHGPARILAIEPDPETLRRLRDNLAASGAAEVQVAPVALAERSGRARLAGPAANRGEIALLAPESAGRDGGPEPAGDAVETRPLLTVVQAAGFGRIDALKLDIEGAEAPVLEAFLAEAPAALWPRLVILESRRGEETPALALLRRSGYVELERSRMNAILASPPEGLQAATMTMTVTSGVDGET